MWDEMGCTIGVKLWFNPQYELNNNGTIKIQP